jgi:hypothetical protein
MFPEGVGSFDFKPVSYDNVLTISSIGILGFVFGSYLREKIYVYKAFKDKNISFLDFYLDNRKIILKIFFLVIFSFSIFNFIFYIYQKGTVPLLTLPFKLNYLVGWLLTFGFASFSSLIIYVEFLVNKKYKYSAILFGFIEVFISSVSLLSRAMIFNGFSLLLGLYRIKEILDNKINKVEIIKYFIILLILFLISLISVGKIRENRDFPIGHEVHSYIPKIKVSKSSGIISEEINKNINYLNQILFLIAGRWVGIEGVMCIYAKKDKGLDLLAESLSEKFNFNNSFYENNIKGSYYKFSKDPPVYTVYTPGLFAYLYYSGSKIFLFVGVLILTLFASYLEFLACKFSKNNLIFSSLIGNVIAYRFAHFGYLPLNSYKIFIAIIITIFLIWLIMNYKFKKNK